MISDTATHISSCRIERSVGEESDEVLYLMLLVPELPLRYRVSV